MTSPIRVDVASEDDFAALAKIESSAFANDAMANALFRNVTDPNARFERALKFISKCSHDETMALLKSIIGDEVVGVAIWAKPNWKPNPEDDKDDIEINGFDKEMFDDFISKSKEAKEKVCGGQDVWYLLLLATSPKHRGLGVATPLLRWGLDQADEQGLPAYLNASPLGKPVYLKYGFVVKDEFKIVDGTIPIPCMLRQPRE